MEALLVAAKKEGLIASLAPLSIEDEDRARYDAWLAAGMAAGMEYLARTREARLFPERAFPWAKSALVVAAPYYFPEQEVPKGGLRLGRVARYAWTRDYHLTLGEAVARLEERARRLGLRAKGYVDHGPVMEGVLARAAGLGFLGKNTLLIRPGLGSYLLLGVVLLDYELKDFPEEVPSRCGSCTRCLSTCPVAALGPFGLDARRCISYWTIETRKPIPPELWDAFGDWLFGCDDCQEACPWNRFAERGGYWRGFAPEPELAHPDLWDFLRLSNRAFEKKYAGTAFLRPGRAGMARNAIRLLAATRHEALSDYLEAAAKDPSPLVRMAAAAGFYRLGKERLLDDPDPRVRAYARGLWAQSSPTG